MSNNSEVFGSSSVFNHSTFSGLNQYQAGYQGGRHEKCGSGVADYGAHGYGGARQGLGYEGSGLGDDLPEY